MTAITLLDGGMGQELIKRSGRPPSPLWATQVLIDQPHLVADVHLAYADAGATVATTNSYAIHRDRLRGADKNHYAAEGLLLPNREDDLVGLLHAATSAADDVRDRCRIAGAVGPLGGSYNASLHPESDVAQSLFGEIVSIIEPRVDLILFETVPSIRAARDALAAARDSTDLPVWLAFTVDDDNGALLRSGERVVDAARAVRDADALLANCSAPEAMPKALSALATVGKPIGAYANAFQAITGEFIAGGTTVSSLSAREDLTAHTYAQHALTWVAEGATIIGGCCETNPSHIAEIARRLRGEGYSLV